MAHIIVFETQTERAECSAGISHNWENQPSIFGTETKKALKICDQLKKNRFRNTYYPNRSLDEAHLYEQILLKKLYGIAKSHGVFITWHGKSTAALEPDRFTVSGRGFYRLAFIQC